MKSKISITHSTFLNGFTLDIVDLTLYLFFQKTLLCFKTTKR